MKFEGEHFIKFKFTEGQIKKNFDNACKDSDIAKKDEILDVKFTYAYTAFIKAGVALLSFYGVKIRGIPGHHIKVIEEMSKLLKDDSVVIMGNLIRSKRNIDFYSGGVEVTEKECNEYIEFTVNVLENIRNLIYPRK